jgi:hypothetical protein
MDRIGHPKFPTPYILRRVNGPEAERGIVHRLAVSHGLAGVKLFSQTAFKASENFPLL